ncbi:MAG: lipoprotein [Alphaproteobacteria bacterium]|nr:lipoprotein [Alphaproteobacteria bacterium]
MRYLYIIISIIILSSCGVKGDLYLPEKQEKSQTNN